MLHGRFPNPTDPPQSFEVANTPSARGIDRRTFAISGLGFLLGGLTTSAVARMSGLVGGTTKASAEDATERASTPPTATHSPLIPDWLAEMRRLPVADRIQRAGYYERLSRRVLGNSVVAEEFEQLAMLVLVSDSEHADAAGKSCVRTLAKFERWNFLSNYQHAVRRLTQLAGTRDTLARRLRERR